MRQSRTQVRFLHRFSDWFGFGGRPETGAEEALTVAREQNAKSWELRAAISYAKFMHGQKRRTEASQLLQPIYDWFTEGHDTHHLREAAALLEELR